MIKRITLLGLAMAGSCAWASDSPPAAVQLVASRSFTLETERPPVGLEEFGPGTDESSALSQPLKSYPDVWEHMRSGFAIPDLDDPRVAKHEAWYAKRPDYVARMIGRSQRYMYFIVTEVEKRGMPMEIALLPMIESAYNPMALSRARASGIWQFIPSTGKLYGLQQNWWFDARRDVVAATEGALDYLQKLHNQFGDWQLALAAYNWGEGGVARAIARNRAKNKPTDYASLKMPKETRNYIPKLQAIKNIVSRPEAFGLQLAVIPDTPYFKTVEAPAEIDVKVAAELAEMPLEEFLSLNPAHNRPVILGGESHTLLLPYDKAEVFAAKLMLHDQPLVSWRAYKLKASDKLETIAARCGLSPEALKAVNGVSARKRIPPGFTLLIPVAGSNDDGAASLHSAVFTALPGDKANVHRVRRGETLGRIAARYGVTSAQLRAWNGLRNDTVSAGVPLRVSAGGDLNSGRHRKRHAAGGKAGVAKVAAQPRKTAKGGKKNPAAA
jgi:membrane-bound lytic murein transglycosylase D